MSGQRAFRVSLSVLLVAVMILSVGVVLPAGAAPAKRGEVPKRPRTVTTASGQQIAAKLDAKLRKQVEKAGRDEDLTSVQVDIAVLAAKDSAKPAGMKYPLKMKLRGDKENDLWVGKAEVGALTKIATAKDVAYVYENGRREPPVVPDSSDVKAKTGLAQKKAIADTKAKLEAAKDAGALEKFAAQFNDDGTLISEPPIVRDGDAATGWFDVSAEGHNSVGAWNLGFTGTGVKVAVADDSVDFAHPDLMGTQATISDASSPYDGWPQAFDPYSLLLYAYDQFYGTPYVSDGYTWFSDTSATMTEADPTFDGETITTPGTSLSGTYHMGYLWDENYYSYVAGVYPMILIADENTAGVYDTVYVDLYPDFDFSYEKPCTKASPTSYIDLWNVNDAWGPDGLADLSGGMVYWIADGSNQPPGAEFMFGEFPSAPASGDMVCFMGSLNVGEDHGTLCSSNVVGQGITDSWSVYGDYPSFKTPEGGGNGVIQGAGKDAELVAIADIYWNHFASTLAAYDYATFGLDETPGTSDDVQVVSNSYGESDDDGDSWDYRSRYLTALNTYVNPTTSFLFSTGNGAPGYGTNAPPSPATGIAVGASTQMGAAGGWDSIYDLDQVTVGDVIPWSNRGPTAAGGLAPNVVADGAYSTGAIPLNMSLNGAHSWDIWGGTSRSCPVAAGNLTLVYQAYKDANGEWPSFESARQLLMNGARDLNYDTFTQGAGMIDAGRSVSLASNSGGVAVAPESWQPGDFLNEQHVSFMNAVHAGDTYTTEFTVTNTGASASDVTLSDAWYQRQGSTSLDITMDSSQEDAYNFDRPDYLTEITDMIPAGTDLVVARVTQDIEEFAPTGAFSLTSSTHNVVRALVYDWKDQDTDGALWNDANSNGYVNVGEMDPGEYMRFTYHNNFANAHEVRVQTPLDRMHDGVFLGLQHTARATANGVTTVHVELSFYQREDMPWLTEYTTGATLGAGNSVEMGVRLDVPADAPVGVYEGEFRVEDGTNVSVVPVAINVVSPYYGFSFGEQDTPSVDSIMPNNQLFGAQDWNWRAESGDWRFYSADGSGESVLPDGAAWLVHTSWPDNGAPDGLKTDNDTLLFGPTPDEFSDMDPGTFGPYTLGLTGGSANTNIGAGIWTFQTNSGTTEEWVASPLTAGLNQIMIHNVLYDGKQPSAAISGEAGIVSVMPSAISIVSSATAGTEAVDFSTYSLDLSGVTVESFGLSKRTEETADITTGADWTKEVTLTNAAYLDVQTACPDTDIDLYVYVDDGAGGWTLVGASETATGEEQVRIERPADGTYLIDVYGYSVSGTQPFDISIASPMGNDATISGVPAGAVTAGTGFTFDIDWTKDRTALADREGTYEGIVYLGPNEAPGAVQIPVSLRYPFVVESSTPAGEEVVHAADAPIQVRFSKRLDQVALDDATFFVTQGGDPVAGTIDYDDASATVSFTPDAPLVHLGDYQIVMNGVASVDGDVIDEAIPFRVDLTDRAAGADRYQTAVDISAKNFPSSDTVVLATGERFPDALTASGLAGANNAPLLLTEYDALPAAVADEIARLGASRVVLVGGPQAISEDVAEEVDALAGIEVGRVYGADRYETAAEVARSIGYVMGDGLSDTCFLARGDTFPDALSLSPFAYSQRIPILLTKPAAMPAVTSDVIEELGFSEMLVAGDTEAVSLGAASVAGMSRIDRAGGVDRYATAAEVAAYGVSRGWGDWSFVGVATGENYPDGLAGGVGTGANGGVMLLTPSTSLSGFTADAITDNAADIATVEIFGGPAAIAESVRDAISDLLLP